MGARLMFGEDRTRHTVGRGLTSLRRDEGKTALMSRAAALCAERDVALSDLTPHFM